MGTVQRNTTRSISSQNNSASSRFGDGDSTSTVTHNIQRLNFRAIQSSNCYSTFTRDRAIKKITMSAPDVN